MSITYRAATSEDATAISLLIQSLAGFIENGAVNPASGSYGDTIMPEAIQDRVTAPGFVYFVAEDASGICGVAGLRDARHLYHLFVKKECHRQGIARELWRRLMSTSSSTFFTVNSSLFAVPVYLRLGFEIAGEEQTRNGLTVQPMMYLKASQVIVFDNPDQSPIRS